MKVRCVDNLELLLKTVDGILKQLLLVLKAVDEKIERTMLLYICEILLDLVFINERQAKTGMADVGKCLKDRIQTNLEKRVFHKMSVFGNIANTEFF